MAKKVSGSQGKKEVNFPRSSKLQTLMVATFLTQHFDTADRESVSLRPVDSQIDR